MGYEYRIIRSKRKSLGLEINKGEIIVRAPYGVSSKVISEFVFSHSKWIEKHLLIQEERNKKASEIAPLSSEEIIQLKKLAKVYIEKRVRYFAPLVGVSYNKISIRAQKTRWGSASTSGNLSFNCLLMLAPDEVIDSVVVHELCHRKHMNHSKAFYDEVIRVYPEYKKCNKWLKENGPAILQRWS